MQPLESKQRLDVRDTSVYCDALVYGANRHGLSYRLDPRTIVEGRLDLGATIAAAVREAYRQAACVGRRCKLLEFQLRRAMDYGRVLSSPSICEIASAFKKPPHTLLLRRYLDEDCVEHPALATFYRYAFSEVVVGAFQPRQVDEQLREQAEAMLLPSTIEKLRTSEPDLFETALANLADHRRVYNPAIDGPPLLLDLAKRQQEDTARLRDALEQPPLVRRRLRAAIKALSIRLLKAATDLDLYEFDTINNQLTAILDLRDGTVLRSFAKIRNSLWYECCMKTYYRLSETDKAAITKNYFQTTLQLTLCTGDLMNSQLRDRATLEFEAANHAHLSAYVDLAQNLSDATETGRRG